MATQLANRDDSNVARRPDPSTPQGLAYELDKGAEQLRRALPAHISPEKFQRTVLTAAQANPDLLRSDRQALLLACMKAAQDGLLPDGREAAFVIFNNREKDGQGKWVNVKKAQYMPMVYGLRKKILQSGEIRDITAKVVYRAEYERGTFLYEEGTERMLRHKPDLMLSDEEMQDEHIVAAYSIATFTDGSMSYEVMSRAEINKVRQVSKTGALGMKTYQGADIAPKGPWVDWFGEMAKKTVMRRHSKTLPMSGDLIDVEGSEVDHAELAQSARSVLSVETDAPVSLPAHDPVTGELVEAATDENPTATDDPADEQRSDQSGDSDDAPYAAMVAELMERIAGAQTVIDVNNVQKDWMKHAPALPDEENERIEAALNARIDVLKGAGA